jgi:hypothetical protein
MPHADKWVGKLGQPGAKIVPVAGAKPRPARQRTAAITGDAAARFGIDQYGATHRDEKGKMRLDCRDLRSHRPLEKPAAIPPRDQRQPEPSQDMPQYRGISRKLVAELDPLVSRPPRLGEAAVERRVAPQFR